MSIKLNNKFISIKEESRLFSQIEKESQLFFSLVTYRNDLLMSKNPERVLEFYRSFNNTSEIIAWLRERPKGRSKVIDIEGDNEVIVVIPTASVDNEHSQRCKNEIFKGMRIIFVESGNFGDPYFSFSHNCNVGISKALEYKPKYIIWTNDDMLKLDSAAKLRDEIDRVLDKKPIAIFARKNYQVSTPVKIVKFNFLGKILLKSIKYSKTYKIIRSNAPDTDNFVNHNAIFVNSFERYVKLSIYNKFRTRFFLSNIKFVSTSILFKKVAEYINFDAFGILRADFISDIKEVFDENIIVQHADQDLSLRFGLNPKEISWIDYSIKGIGRATIKDNTSERLRSILADIYIDHKIRNNEYPNLIVT